MINNYIDISFVPDYYVYTDGACHNNGKVYAVAGIGIYFGKNDKRNISKRVIGKQTNNVAELTALIEVYDIIKNDITNGKKVIIVSDSEYAIRCVTTYGKKCFDNNFISKKKKFIPNQDLVLKSYELYKEQYNVKFMHCKAHTLNTDIHSIGNFEADKLANLSLR